MKKTVLLGLSAGLVLLAGLYPASAQYYGDPGYRQPPPYGYRPPPPPEYGYDRRPGYGYDRPPAQYGRPYGRARGMSNICATSRGSCETRFMPIGADCRCNIPGFGRKRGNIE